MVPSYGSLVWSPRMVPSHGPLVWNSSTRAPQFPNHFQIISDSAIPSDSPVGVYSPAGVYIVTFDRDATHISDSYLNRLRPVRPPPVASSHFTFACDRMKRHEINSQLTVVVFRRHQPRPGARAVPGASISATHRFPHLTAAHRFPHLTAPIGSRPP